jgi:hypothetical protein
MQALKKDLNRALKMLKIIDDRMAKMGKNRQYRRAFWREFIKDGQVRTDVFSEIEKELK